MAISPIPDGYRSVTPYLIVDDAARALDFYATVFGAVESVRMPMPGGKVGHAEIKIGDSMIMLADEMPEMGYSAPPTFGGTPVSLMLYVADVDAQFAKAVAAGATVKVPLKDEFYGDRTGQVTDPFGHVWILSTHIEDVSPEEMERRMSLVFSVGQS